MRVGLFVPDVTPDWGGAHTFVVDLLRAIEAMPTRHEIVLLHLGGKPPVEVSRYGARRVAWEAPSGAPGHLDAAARELGLEIVWFTTPHAQPVDLPYIATVWDLEHRNQPYFPEVVHGDWGWEAREGFYRATLPRATVILTGTKAGRRQIRDFYAVSPDRVVVVPLPTPSFSHQELEGSDRSTLDLELADPYLFYPAQFWPHKNHVTLLHALAELAADGIRVSAVFTGGDRGNREHVEATARRLGVVERVRFLGFVDRRALVTLYRNALALVFPSFFGPDNLPPLEAFALDCPVLAAAVPGAEEYLGDAALLFDPHREADLAAAVRRLLQEPSLAGELVRRGNERSRRWTAADYVASVLTRVDEFAAVRRCWNGAGGEAPA